MALGIRDQRVTLAFTSGAGSRRYRNHRQHRLSGPAITKIVRHPAAVSQQKVDALDSVHQTATTKTNDRIDLQGRDESSAVLDHTRVGIDLELVKTKYLDTSFL